VIEAAQAFGGWLLAASLAAAIVAVVVRAWRRRVALNEALHELRRPLQAIALGPAFATGSISTQTPVQLAAAALERLEREINGGPVRLERDRLAARPLLEDAVARWAARARLEGGSIALRWRAGDAVIAGDRVGLAQALDNLIVNAIEHGGSSISVEADRRGERLAIRVSDSGQAGRQGERSPEGAELFARIAGRRRRGHGMSVVRRTAVAHRGTFIFRRCAGGSQAVLELPLAIGARHAA